MPNLYARQTALPNIQGRCDYISSPKRQEHLLGVYDGAAGLLGGGYWNQLAKESQAAFAAHGETKRLIRDKKTGEMVERQLKAVEGRELVIQLPNSVLERLEPAEVARILAQSFEQRYGRPAMVAVHLNKAQTNVHAHLVYSERELLREPAAKVAQRALFYDESGKRRYKKAEILDDSGQVRPGCRIVAKGEIYDQRSFGVADPAFSRRGWLKAAKSEWLLPLLNGALRGDIEYQEYDPASGKLALQHVGKELLDAAKADAEEQNRLRREWNRAVDERLISQAMALRYQQELEARGEKTSLLRMTVDLIRMAATKGEYIPEWIQDEQPATGKTISFDGDRALQAQLDALHIAREQDCSADEAFELMRRRVGRELAAAREAGDREAQRRAARQYAGVKQGQQQVTRSFAELEADARRRQQKQAASKRGQQRPKKPADWGNGS